MTHTKNRVIAVLLGVALAFVSITIAGIGAAVVVPAAMLKPVAQVSGLLAIILVDLFTIAVPLAVAFLMVAAAGKLVIKRPDLIFYALILAPLMLLQMYFVLQSQPQMLSNIVIMLTRSLLLILCWYLLVRSTHRANI